jgi:hypothetical protein
MPPNVGSPVKCDVRRLTALHGTQDRDFLYCMLIGVPKSMAHVGLGAPNSRSLVRRHSFAGFLIALAAPKRPSAERRTYGGGPTGGSSASGLCDSHFLGGGLLLQARSLFARVHIAREAFVRQLRGMETSQATP